MSNKLYTPRDYHIVTNFNQKWLKAKIWAIESTVSTYFYPQILRNLNVS